MNGSVIPSWYIWVIGILLPLVVAFLTKATWPRQVKSLVALGAAILAGLGATWITGQFNTANILGTITIVFTLSQLFYDQFFKETINKQRLRKTQRR